MCDALRELMKDELDRAWQEGFQIGLRKSLLCAITRLMERQAISAEEAMDLLDIPAADREFYLSKLYAQMTN